MLTRLLDSTGSRSMRTDASAGLGLAAARGINPQTVTPHSRVQKARRPNDVLMPRKIAAPCGNHEPNYRPCQPYDFFPNTFFNHAATAINPTITTFFAASSATSSPLKSPALAASPPATSAASP